jgi:hypothetical protein
LAASVRVLGALPAELLGHRLWAERVATVDADAAVAVVSRPGVRRLVRGHVSGSGLASIARSASSPPPTARPEARDEALGQLAQNGRATPEDLNAYVGYQIQQAHGASIAGLMAGDVNWAEVAGEVLKTLSAEGQAEW